MIQTKLITKKINSLLICLDSLDLYILDYLHISTIRKLYKRQQATEIHNKYYIDNQSKYSIQEILDWLYIVNNIILEEHLKEKIQTILNEYSSYSSNHRKDCSMTTKQYLNRFMYKYQIFYKYNLTRKINTINKQRNNFYNIAIINLYILNKILSTNGPYILYKYLYINKYDIKSRLC